MLTITKEDIEIALTKLFQAVIKDIFQRQYGDRWYENELMPHMIASAEEAATETGKKYGDFLGNKGTSAALMDMDVTVCANVLLFDEKYTNEIGLDNSKKQMLHEMRSDKNRMVSHSGILTESMRTALFSRVISDLQMASDIFRVESFDSQLADEIQTLQEGLFHNKTSDTADAAEDTNDPLAQQYKEGERMQAQGNLRDAFGIHEELAEMGYAPSMLKLANFYIKGIGTKENLEKAEQWLADAKKQGNEESAALLEKLLEFKSLQEQALEKSSVALVKLGIFYENGDLVKQDLDKAMDYYSQAADQGSFLAKKRIEAMASSGNPKALKQTLIQIEGAAPEAKKDLILQALSQTTEEADWKDILVLFQDHSGLMFEIAYALYNKKSSDKDLDLCRMILERGTELAYAGCINMLGALYFNGEGVNQDYKKAAELFTNAKDLGSVTAFANLLKVSQYTMDFKNALYIRLAYQFSKHKTQKNETLPMGLVKRFFDKRLLSDFGESNLINHDVDDREVFEIYKEAAEMLFEPVYIRLTRCYHYGFGTEVDKRLALKWYERSEKKAYLQMAMIYYEEGECQDKEKALYLFKKEGSSLADYYIGRIYQEEGKLHDDEMAFRCFNAYACREEEYYHHSRLGLCYYYGMGTTQNKELAAKSFLIVEKAVMRSYPRTHGLFFDMYYPSWNDKDDIHGRNLTMFKDVGYELGLFYLKGEYVKQNERNAWRCFQTAAYQNNHAAALYEYAKLVRKNNIAYKIGHNYVAGADFELDERGFPSCGKYHLTSDEMLWTCVEMGYQPAVKGVLALYRTGEMVLSPEQVRVLNENIQVTD